VHFLALRAKGYPQSGCYISLTPSTAAHQLRSFKARPVRSRRRSQSENSLKIVHSLKSGRQIAYKWLLTTSVIIDRRDRTRFARVQEPSASHSVIIDKLTGDAPRGSRPTRCPTASHPAVRQVDSGEISYPVGTSSAIRTSFRRVSPRMVRQKCLSTPASLCKISLHRRLIMGGGTDGGVTSRRLIGKRERRTPVGRRRVTNWGIISCRGDYQQTKPGSMMASAVSCAAAIS
jgi:hypothetical protein